MNRHRGWLRRWRGSTVEDVVEIVRRQLAVTARGAELARSTLLGEVDAATAAEEMKEVEHDGDLVRRELIERLGRVLVTPIDREDLFRFSRSVDDVLDNVRDFARELELYGVGPDPAYAPMVTTLIEGIEHLGAAVGESGARRTLGVGTIEARKCGRQIRSQFESHLAELLAGDVSSDVLRRRELLRRLDVVGLRLVEAADAWADGVLKRT